eukprot:924194-Rhodomonas_salina.3
MRGAVANSISISQESIVVLKATLSSLRMRESVTLALQHRGGAGRRVGLRTARARRACVVADLAGVAARLARHAA